MRHGSVWKGIFEVGKSIKKPNILICGETGVGKSSLINDIFQIKLATVGNDARPQTQKAEKYSSDESTVNIIDTKGYEIGMSDDVLLKTVIGEIDSRKKEYASDFEKQIHEVWYCINNRFMDIDKKIINEVKRRNVPVVIIITKVDDLDDSQIGEIKDAIFSKLSDVEVFTYATIEYYPDTVENYSKKVQKTDLLAWAQRNLEMQLQSGFVSSLKGSLAEKKNFFISHKLPFYVGAAGVAIIGMAGLNISFADSAPLMAIQIKMTMDIMKLYGIDSGTSAALKNLVGASAISYLGRTAATQIFAALPIVGNIAKATVNVSVGMTITAILGISITLMCEQYLKLTINNGGKSPIPDFSEFFTKERLEKIMKSVERDQDKYGIPEIVKNVYESIKNKASRK